ncbi:DUF6910 family protein [Nocardioides halotolerans]|uniref:DUF6910 family protein n=1 Tax=Nocardioides halotolerans TaxID=433660 RepID=UPI000429FBBB|nr:hypothetical protein [Nocardioides halotolerans]
MRIELAGATPLRFRDGTPVRAASGIARYAAGWLVVQDDATHGCVWEAGSGRRLRLLPPVQGHDTFAEAAGTKALKPDLEAVVALPDGRTLALGSGSTAARMRCVLLSESAIQVAGLAPVYAHVADVLEVPADQLNLEGATVVGEALRWFQRGLPSAGAPTASVDVALDALLDQATGAPAAVRVSAVRRYDLGTVAGVGLAITDAIGLPGGLVLVSAAAEDSPSTYDDGPVVGAALALLDGEQVLDLAELPLVDGAVAKLEGLALAGRRDDVLDLVAVVDADDPAVPSLLLELAVTARPCL